jgi:hypothetical protein
MVMITPTNGVSAIFPELSQQGSFIGQIRGNPRCPALKIG